MDYIGCIEKSLYSCKEELAEKEEIIKELTQSLNDIKKLTLFWFGGDMEKIHFILNSALMKVNSYETKTPDPSRNQDQGPRRGKAASSQPA